MLKINLTLEAILKNLINSDGTDFKEKNQKIDFFK